MKRLFLSAALPMLFHVAGWSHARIDTVDPRAVRQSSLAVAANVRFGDQYEEAYPIETNFYLLDKSLVEILKAAKFKPEFADGSTRQLTDEDYLEAAAKVLVAAPDDAEAGVIAFLIDQAISRHRISVAPTNRYGRGNFKRIKTGGYYLFGVGRTEAEVFVWHLPVQVKPGADFVEIDQTDAAVIFPAEE